MISRRHRILWIDDKPDPEFLKFELDLNNLPVTINYASTVLSAKQKLSGNVFDIVILDWILPEDSNDPEYDPYKEPGGMSLLRHIDAIRGDKSNSPTVIIFSSSVGYDLAFGGFAAMMSEHTGVANFLAVEKSDRSTLIETVVAILKQSLS
jgi:CheY-like chemotaxis protein